VFADWAGRFYAEPGVTLTMQVLALNFVIIPFGSVTMALLVRNMDFAKTLQINLACCVVQNATAIRLAWAGFGFISLAWGAVASTLLSSVVLLWFRFPGQSWLPGLRNGGMSFRPASS
jgi:O-antigen/teichoic acid export membrane protein